MEGLSLLVRCEVAALPAPGGGRVGDAADHLLHAPFALGGGHAATEVLLRDDVRRRLGPEPREFDVSLLEDGAALARDQRIAGLPFDLVERVAAGDREVPRRCDARGVVEHAVDELALFRLRCLRCLRRLLGGGHAVPPGAEMSDYSSRRARGGASCERTGHPRTPVGRHKKPAICRKIGRSVTQRF